MWRRAPYLGGTSDSFWRKAEAFVLETEIPEETLSLVPEVPHEEADLIHPSSVLRASHALEPIRLSTELNISKNNANIDLMVSRWSTDTHTFVFPWGDGGPTLQDTAILMRLSTRGSAAFDPSSLSSADARLVDRLRRAYTEADLPSPRTAPLAGQEAEFYGKLYDSDLHLAGFLVYWLSFFVVPDFPYEGLNHNVFPLTVSLARGDFVLLGPFFLGSLFHRLDQVHTDSKRSMGCYDMVSVVHTQFLMAFCFEHFPSLAPSPADISGGDESQPRIMRWSGVSSTKSWGNQIDDAGAFFLRPYAEPVEGALPTNFFSENDRIVDFQTEGVAVSTSALAAFAAACPCSLPALCTEGTRSMLYRPDRVARQFGYDQGAPGRAPPLRSYAESLRRFTRAHVEELAEGYNVVVLPRNDRETFFTDNGRLAWHRNLDSFINYVRGVPEIPAFSDVYHRDVSLRSPKARQPGWRGKKSYWAPSSTTPVASRGITIAEPISSVIPPRVTRSSFRYDGGEHTPLSKLKRKREDEEACEGGSDSNIDDNAPISQSFKLPRTAGPSSSGKSVAEDQKVIPSDERGSDGTDGNAEDSDARDSEEGEDSGAERSEEEQSDENGDGEDHSGGDDDSGNLGRLFDILVMLVRAVLYWPGGLFYNSKLRLVLAAGMWCLMTIRSTSGGAACGQRGGGAFE
ncbi:hypothetical protein RHGRI_030905 [Rhododendron griersonianum]|uniref:Aminotransferase-like plant mobile domain-containing protein n=1 Tax=Rhododendron griersonianum TaxID=479676 RepID=A0AAV6I5W0_9ERIC|nr:hypothetical protein RHGRI_030905 [Rhododendron griersonianum]